jgi:hypothetical protein
MIMRIFFGDVILIPFEIRFFVTKEVAEIRWMRMRKIFKFAFEYHLRLQWKVTKDMCSLEYGG